MTHPKRLKERLGEICSRYGIEILYAFGSRTDEIKRLLEGEIQRLGASGSDADLGAKPGPGVLLSVREKARMNAELEDLLGVDRVDLCFVNETDPFVAAEIVRGEGCTARTSFGPTSTSCMFSGGREILCLSNRRQCD